MGEGSGRGQAPAEVWLVGTARLRQASWAANGVSQIDTDWCVDCWQLLHCHALKQECCQPCASAGCRLW